MFLFCLFHDVLERGHDVIADFALGLAHHGIRVPRVVSSLIDRDVRYTCDRTMTKPYTDYIFGVRRSFAPFHFFQTFVCNILSCKYACYFASRSPFNYYIIFYFFLKNW